MPARRLDHRRGPRLPAMSVSWRLRPSRACNHTNGQAMPDQRQCSHKVTTVTTSPAAPALATTTSPNKVTRGLVTISPATPQQTGTATKAANGIAEALLRRGGACDSFPTMTTPATATNGDATSSSHWIGATSRASSGCAATPGAVFTNASSASGAPKPSRRRRGGQTASSREATGRAFFRYGTALIDLSRCPRRLAHDYR